VSGTRSLRRMGYKKRYKRGGLLPTYRGWAPRSLLRGEWKYSDVSTSVAADTTGAHALMNGLSMGNSATTRVGSRIAIRSLELRGFIQATPGTGLMQAVRFLLVLDKQANHTAPTVGEYLSSNSLTGLRNLTHRKRFRIILDKTFPIDVNVSAVTYGIIKPYHYYLKMKRPLAVDYNAANNGTVADIESNSLYFYIVGTEAAGNTDSTNVGVCRMRFSDV